MYALSLTWWAASWNLRNSVLMSWVPVGAIWVGGAAVALCLVHRLGQPLRLDTKVFVPLVVLVVSFLPGAVLSTGEGYGPVKIATMIFVVLPVLCAALVLPDSPRARWSWVSCQAGLGVVVAAPALEFHNPLQILEAGRFTLATVDTISTARMIGAAVVALLLAGLADARHRWWTLPVAVCSVMVLVHVGSRGPLLAVLAATLLVVLGGQRFAGRRSFAAALIAGIGAAAFLYARSDGGLGGRRIFQSVQSGLSDDVRAQLLHDAVHLGLAHPLGVGWGDFALHSDMARAIANEQGVAYAHNVLAEAFAEGGVVALVGLSVFVAVGVHRLWRRSAGSGEAVLLGTTVYWFLNAQVSSDLVGNRFMWISLACALATCTPSRRTPGPTEAVVDGHPVLTPHPPRA